MMNNENGRSMVEMLGVLAIIGVLSVAGIAGYSMAMKKYRVNEVLNTASQLVVLARAANQGTGGSASLTDLGYGTNDTVSGYKMKATCNASSCTVELDSGNTGSTDNNSVWKAAKDALGTNGVGAYYTMS